MGHGSRDAEGVREFAALLEALRQARPTWWISGGMLEYPGEALPSIQDAIDAAIAAGARRILAAPVLLFPAGHAKYDMPQEVATARRRYPSLEIVEVPYLGSDEALLDVVADRAAEAQTGRTEEPGETALL
ncbi:MAG TPA: CbiX/SirB N-terminal domain-containing protein, partial [Dehalococcoidia bacterium]|nr:CbiX/SirB N-terminal domain-containing protein [Dehalococcoidia bacterium]